MKVTLALMVIALIVIGLNISKNPIQYACGHCKARFNIKMLSYFFTVQRSGKKYLKCPECGKRSWAASETGREGGLFRKFRW